MLSGVARAAEGGLMNEKPDTYPVASFAGGCFWCVEYAFREMPGVVYTRVGYSGGGIDRPNYGDVSTGKTGHAEAVEVYYDPEKTDYETLVMAFLKDAHDPTQKNRQGVDVGPQYRSVIFYHDDEQKRIAQEAITRLTAEKYYKKPIVTEILPARTFWKAEDYHQQYYEKYETRTGQPHIRVLLKERKKAEKQ
ncbi:MAG: peptide-methionine (S)-S-oxide reductase MsrA [Alphaproteobacteria bacterium]|nr:peptide-methionine (S)-S-oxide reductase MsrA [Alphaproteobacteria bacterium]